ncbi:uncharacterized protein [Panulirus ornatus]|uniref:uncharacterized protein n=1 Tax=Panulirus ornatus TaxID=150431 RepID=UPI003A854FAF
MATEMKDLSEAAAKARDDVEVEAGQSSSGEEEGQGVAKKETVVVRLGEGKLTGPMRFITCYATVFTFVVMTGGIVWLLLISPPFNVAPETLPGRSGAGLPQPTSVLQTTVFPTETETPEFSSDFNQA